LLFDKIWIFGCVVLIEGDDVVEGCCCDLINWLIVLVVVVVCVMFVFDDIWIFD
jgi:hypothetical protein